MLKSQVDLYEVYEKWTNGLEKYKCYFKATPLASLKQCEDFEIKEAEFSNEAKLLYEEFQRHSGVKDNKTGENKADTYTEADVSIGNKNMLYIFDMPAIDGIDLAVILNNKLKIKPILVFNHICHDFGIVGSREFINKLISSSSKLQATNGTSFAFMLDYDRYKTEEFNRRDYFNNQYELTEEDLPPLEILKELSIDSFTVFLKGTMKEDLKDYLLYLEKGNIDINIHNL